MKITEYPSDAPPVFVGHYWLKESNPSIQSSNVVCLDYSVAKEGYLIAYRWNAGQPLDEKNLVSV